MHYEPWNILNELNSLLTTNASRATPRDDTNVETSRWLPAVDIKEESDQYLILADLPGVDSENIDISMENNILVIKGSRETDVKTEKKDYYRIERVKGEFYRRFTLPDNADGETIKAVNKNGVLTITIPKKQQAISKMITVEDA